MALRRSKGNVQSADDSLNPARTVRPANDSIHPRKQKAAERMNLDFTVHAIPVAQPRARSAVIGGHIRVYEPKDSPVATFKRCVRLAASRALLGAHPFGGPVRLDCTFIFPRPQSLMFKTRSMPRVLHAKKPDIDNLLKSVCDALNGLAWRDDCQVCEVVGEKWIAAGYEGPHVVIRIKELSIAIDCPGCSQAIDYVSECDNYPCERCGVLWKN